jgi:hypothetical protein
MPNIFSERRIILVTIVILAIAHATQYLLWQASTPAYMAAPQLSDISAHLVTADNPPRDTDALDHERCALLHNFLVEYNWVADGRSLADLDRRSFFERYGDEADEIRERLDPSLVAFLEAIYDVEDLTFFFWVKGITPPSDMWANQLEDSDEDGDGDGGKFLTLYVTNTGLGEHGDGLTYDQTNCKATMALGIEDQGFARPVEDHRELWHPLETILSNWIKMIELGKITASPDDAENEKYGPWIWHSYSEAQVDSTLAAFNRLVEAIESRMPAASLLPAREAPLLSDADLDAASIPESCFVRPFLTQMRVPRLEFIAPGLLVPHDREAFISKQSFTTMDSSSEDGEVIPPVLLFRATDHTANFDCDDQYKSLNPFCKPYIVAKGDHSVPTGLYSESVRRFEVDNAEEGFRLVLPFALGREEGGAKMSDGQRLEKGVVADLFQHGFKPFGGEWWRAQRLERLFGKWTELVENGVWQVDERGVVGEVEMFRDADGGRWRDYYIEPEW